MTKEEFTQLEAMLYKRGYKKYNQQWHHEDYIIGKGFHKKDNQWEENRNVYQIILSIYDYSSRKDLWDRLSEKERNRVGIEIHVDMSRTIDERIEMVMAWYNNTTIEEVEAAADSFYQWACKMWDKPREEE